MRGLLRASLFLLLSSIGAAGSEVRAGSVPSGIPLSHPRLWLSTPALRTQALQWLTSTGAQPRAEDHAGNAFVSVLTGNPSRCNAPIAWLTGFTLPDIGNVSSDNARWYGENAALVFDWCFDAMTPAQRELVITRWNGYLDTLHAKPWGGRGMAANNYFWGYLRNSLEWAIATWHENAHAPALLQAGIAQRYDQWFVDEYASGFGAGGVPGEGTQYGRYMLGYPVVPFLTLRDYGIDLYARSSFFNEAIYYVLYSTLPARTPGPPSSPACAAPSWYLMPFNDDEAFLLCQPEVARSSDYAMAALAMVENGIGQQPAHALAGWRQVEAELPFWARFRSPAGSGGGLQDLPLDYYAPGPGYVWARSSRAADAAVVLLQLGAHGGVGHRHEDTGSFQFWRDGQWISRETTGYTDMIPSWNGGAAVDVLAAVGHNSVLFEGRGERNWESGGPRVIAPGARRSSNPDGLAQVLRLHHDPAFLYAAVDLSLPYRAASSEDPCRYDWPFAERAIREFVFVRELAVLLVFDRLLAGSDSLGYSNAYCQSVGFSTYNGPRLAAEAVRKTFVAHLMNAASLSGTVATAPAGAHTARIETVWPADATRRLLDERGGHAGSVGQFRLEVDASGAPLTHFLHTVQSLRPGENAVQATLDTSGADWRVTLSRPGSAPVVVTLVPGADSAGGSVTTAAGNTALLPRVQHTWVDATGPHWEDLAAAASRIFADGYE